MALTTDFTGTTFLWGSDYIALPDDYEPYLIESLIPTSGLINLYGKPKTAKSFAAIGMALAISNPLVTEWNGFAVQQHGPVLYIQLDTPRYEWKRRFRNVVLAGHDVSKIAVIDLEIAPYPYNIMSPAHKAWLKLQVDSVKPQFTVIDTLREAHEGDENSSKEMKQIVNTIVALVKPSAVAFVSHSRKDSAFNAMGASSDLMDEGRGSSYISGRMDTVMKFTGTKGKGHMYFKGRAINEGSIPIAQEKHTGLPLINADEAKRQLLLKDMLKTHGPESPDPWSWNKMAETLEENPEMMLKRRAINERLVKLHSGK